MKHTLSLAMTVLIITALAMPQGGASAAQQQAAAQMGKPEKGPKDPPKEFAVQITINDAFNDWDPALKSDGMERLGTGGLDDVTPGWPVVYLDHRVDFLGGPYPDPCVGSWIGDGGSVQFDLDRGNADTSAPLGKNCNISVGPPDHTDDGRTVMLEFKPRFEALPDDNDDEKAAQEAEQAAVDCACSRFMFLEDPDAFPEWPAGETWKTKFEWIDGGKGCQVTPSAGAILTDQTGKTANLAFFSRPFQTEPPKGNGKNNAGNRQNITFRIDVRDRAAAGRRKATQSEKGFWRIGSQEELVPTPGATADIRTNTADVDQLFELGWEGDELGFCSGFKFPLQITFERFALPAQ